jgi:hypothetical protein
VSEHSEKTKQQQEEKQKTKNKKGSDVMMMSGTDRIDKIMSKKEFQEEGILTPRRINTHSRTGP